MPHKRRRKGPGYRSRSLGTKNHHRRAALDAVALNRRNPDLSLDEAARRSGTTVSGVRQYAASAVTFRNGRWRVTASDTEPRELRLLTERGYLVLTLHDSRSATTIADYSNALRDFLQTGRIDSLKRFEGHYAVVKGQKHYFLTDRRTILRFARAGVIQFMDLYADGGL